MDTINISSEIENKKSLAGDIEKSKVSPSGAGIKRENDSLDDFEHLDPDMSPLKDMPPGDFGVKPIVTSDFSPSNGISSEFHRSESPSKLLSEIDKELSFNKTGDSISHVTSDAITATKDFLADLTKPQTELIHPIDVHSATFDIQKEPSPKQAALDSELVADVHTPADKKPPFNEFDVTKFLETESSKIKTDKLNDLNLFEAKDNLPSAVPEKSAHDILPPKDDKLGDNLFSSSTPIRDDIKDDSLLKSSKIPELVEESDDSNKFIETLKQEITDNKDTFDDFNSLTAQVTKEDSIKVTTPEPVKEPTPGPQEAPTTELVKIPSPEPVKEPSPEPLKELTPEPVKEPSPELLREPTPEPVKEPIPVKELTPEPAKEKTPEPVKEKTPEPVKEKTPESLKEPTPEPLKKPAHEPVKEPTPEPVKEPTPEPVKKPTPEPVKELTPEPLREPTPEPVKEPTPEPVRELTPEPVKEPTPEPVRELTPEPVKEPTPEPIEPVKEPTPEPVRELTPEPVKEPTPEPVRELTPEPVKEPTPEPIRELTPEPVREPTPESKKELQPETYVAPTSIKKPEPEPVTESESEPEYPKHLGIEDAKVLQTVADSKTTESFIKSESYKPEPVPEKKPEPAVIPIKKGKIVKTEPSSLDDIIGPEDVFKKIGLDAWFNPDRLHPRVESLVYWRDPKKSGIVFGGIMAILLSLSYFSLISVVAYVSLLTLTGTIIFRVYKNILQAVQKTSEGHPFKEYLEMEVSLPQDKVREAVDTAVTHINAYVVELRRLFLVEDLVDSIKFGVLLWCLTYLGALFNGMTLVIIAFVALFTLPKIYENNKTNIDAYLEIGRSKVAEITSKVKAAVPIGKKEPEKDKEQ